MRFQTLGDKQNFFDVKVRNDSGSSVTKGTPICFTFDGTDDAFAFVTPSSSAPKAHAFFSGVLMETLAANEIGDARVYGYVEDAIVVRQSRAATTDTWASYASKPLGAILHILSDANAFSIGATLGTQSVLPFAVLAETLASGASSASGAGPSGLYKTETAKVFVRAL